MFAFLEARASHGPGLSVTRSLGSSVHPIPQGFSIIILKPYVKSVTHSEKLEWWNILMVECVTILH